MIQKSSISDRFRPQSNRLQGYDYSQDRAYFVTICVKGRECVFGNVENQEMILNEYGGIAEEEIKKTEQIRKNVIVDSFVISI